MQVLDVEGVFEKGMSDQNSLSENEWLIYVVSYFEYMADAEGWDHFFTYFMPWYQKLSRGLKLAGDFGSLQVLKDYENHFTKLGVNFTSKAIDEFLTTASNEYLDSCPDWRDQFSDLGDQRWELISRYYRNIGVELKT